jgi:hypothetical protein
VLADEEMARRLHEELNAGMTRRRGSNAAALKSLELPLEHKASKHEAKGSREAGRHSNATSKQDPAPAKVQLAAAAMEQQGTSAILDDSQVKESAKGSLQSARKRTLLSRELAMLVTDMVEAQLRPAKANRHQASPLPRPAAQRDDSSTEEEEEDHAEDHAAQHSQQAEQAANKPETSSCHSEQDRVLEEHMRSARTKIEPEKVSVCRVWMRLR